MHGADQQDHRPDRPSCWVNRKAHRADDPRVEKQERGQKKRRSDTLFTAPIDPHDRNDAQHYRGGLSGQGTDYRGGDRCHDCCDQQDRIKVVAKQ